MKDPAAPIQIKVQELCRATGRSYLTIRADGRYLGTLYVGPEERVVLREILSEAAWETVEK